MPGTLFKNSSVLNPDQSSDQEASANAGRGKRQGSPSISEPPTKRGKKSASPKKSKPSAKRGKKQPAEPLDDLDDDNEDDENDAVDVVEGDFNDDDPDAMKGKADISRVIDQPQDYSRNPRAAATVYASSDDDDEEEAEAIVVQTKTRKPRATDKAYVHMNGINELLPPLSSVPQFFADQYEKACNEGLLDCISYLNGRPLRVATMCSGTESPILALRHLQKNLDAEGYHFDIEHLFSAELVPFKQHFITANYDIPVLFRDVVELGQDNPDPTQPHMATTVYGSMKVIPDSVDLLIAGFSCVDFSALNQNPRDLEARGESGDTFFAILGYARRYKPRFIVLENVRNAPWSDAAVLKKKKEQNKFQKFLKDNPDKTAEDYDWPHGIDWHLESCGYKTCFQSLDSKEYYVPHTRSRGYMVCIHVATAAETLLTTDELAAYTAEESLELKPTHDYLDKKLTTILARYSTVLKKLERQPSVPGDSLLMVSEALSDFSTRQNEVREVKNAKWERCMQSSEKYREENGYGTSRTLTQWVTGGRCILPDHHRNEGRLTNERQMEVLEIAHLRNVVRGIDDRYYSRTLEMSQNVHRDQNKDRNGIISCMIPLGIPFNTLHGRRLNGYESFALQGIATDPLDLTGISQSQLQDLSGNAMTSTVVGAVLAATLIAGHKLLEEGSRRSWSRTEVDSSLLNEGDLISRSFNLASYDKFAVDDAMSLAAMTLPLCKCEGTYRTLLKAFQQCTTCKHTTCLECGKYPVHSYVTIPKPVIDSRKDPLEFVQMIKKSIPLVFRYTQQQPNQVLAELKTFGKNHSADLDPARWKLILKAVVQAMCSELSFRGVSRKERFWEVTYTSPAAKLVGHFSATAIEWFLYAQDFTLGTATNLVKHISEFPILYMSPRGDDINDGTWKFWLPKSFTTKINVECKGSLMKSYHNEIGLAEHKKSYIYSTIVLETPDGKFTYERAPKCGQTFHSLHQLVGDHGPSAPPYLMLDQKLATGKPAEFCYSLTWDLRRVVQGQYRFIDSFLPPQWRPRVHEISKEPTDAMDADPEKTTLTRNGVWADFGILQHDSAQEQKISYGQVAAGEINLSGHCGFPSAINTYQTKALGFIDKTWARNRWILIDQSLEDTFATEFGYLLERGCIIPGHTLSDEVWHSLVDAAAVCEGCAPENPSLHWTLHENNVLLPHEDLQEAAIFESKIKSRPAPWKFLLYIDGQTNEVSVKLGMDPHSLAHRAFARFRLHPKGSEISTAWRLITDSAQNRFTAFPDLAIKLTRDVAENRQPHFKLASLTLHPQQLRALRWMLDQENNPKAFQECEIVEARIPNINYAAWARATRDVAVKGGVMAFGVGFGKTILTLALFEIQRLEAAQWARNQPIDDKTVIRIKATVIFVPNHIVGQWKSEIEKFLEDGVKVLVLQNSRKAPEIGKSIQDFEEADIILVAASYCDGPDYKKRVAQFAAKADCDGKTSQRAKEAWYDKAVGSIMSNVVRLRDNSSEFGAMLNAAYDAALEAAASVKKNPAPSVRRVGAKYQKWKDDKTIDKPTKTTETPKIKDPEPRPKPFPNLTSYASMKFPILELFAPHRVVVDEFEYTKTGTISLLLRLLARRTLHPWIVSATPSLDGFSDVKTIASLIGIHLGTEDFTYLSNERFKQKIKDMTETEKFTAYQPALSKALCRERHSQAQRFLDAYARTDRAEMGEIEQSKHIRLIRQPAEHFILYIELTHALSAIDFQKENRKLSKFDSNDPKQTIKNIDEVGEALILRSTAFSDSSAKSSTQTSNARVGQFEDLLLEFAKKLKLAEWLHNNHDGKKCVALDDFKSKMRADGTIGDPRARDLILSLLIKTELQYNPLDWKEFFRIEIDVVLTCDTRETAAAKVKAAEVEAAKIKAAKVLQSDAPDIAAAKTKAAKEAAKSKAAEVAAAIVEAAKPLKPEGMCTASNRTHQFQSVKYLRDTCIALNALAEETVKLCRGLRLFDLICRFQRFFGKNLFEAKCDACGFSPLQCDINDFLVLTGCGHLVCREKCMANNSVGCPVDGCDARNEPYQTILGSELRSMPCRDGQMIREVRGQLAQRRLPYARQPNSKDSNVGEIQYGQKIDEMVNLIRKLTKHDKVLVFGQFESSMAKVAAALEQAQIGFFDLTQKSAKSASPATMLKNFQKEKSIQKVLLMNVGDASAAGSNLYVANHVIFVHPYLITRSGAQSTYAAAVEQAIGRAYRFGQTKRVHVYNFISSGTVDVDIFERRDKDKRILKQVTLPYEILGADAPHTGFVDSGVELVHKAHDNETSEFASGTDYLIFAEEDRSE